MQRDRKGRWPLSIVHGSSRRWLHRWFDSATGTTRAGLGVRAASSPTGRELPGPYIIVENGPEMQAYRNSPSWQSEDAISAKQGFDPELLQTASLRVFFGALLVHCPRPPRVPRVPHGGMPPHRPRRTARARRDATLLRLPVCASGKQRALPSVGRRRRRAG